MHRHALPPLPPGRVAPHSSVQTRFPDQTQERSHLTQSEIDLPRPTPEPDFHPLPWTSRSMGTQDDSVFMLRTSDSARTGCINCLVTGHDFSRAARTAENRGL